MWRPASAPASAAPFTAAQRQLSALHPAYVRVLVDWAKLQPSPARAPALTATVSGCDRGLSPCGAYAGIAAELAAIASQQRAGGGFRVLVVIYGTPSWAARAPFGCESASTPPDAHALAPSAIAAYEALVRALLALGAREGVDLEWWSPWNEPNDPAFLNPQRSSCAAGAAAVSPLIYAQLARALHDALAGDAAAHHIVLGELAGFTAETPHTLSIARFIASLPADVLCLAEAWSVHAYADYPPAKPLADAVGALEGALDTRGGCAEPAPIWVSEAGAGAPEAGRPRPLSTGSEAAGCEALARQLSAWLSDPRVQAVFQYSFREDPDFPVGLVSARLTHAYPAYRLWLTFAHGAAPSPATDCT